MAEDNKVNGLAWFVAGLGVGALVGILYAPKAGRETREDLLNGAREGSEYLRNRTRQAAEQVGDLVDKSKEHLGDYVDRGCDSAGVLERLSADAFSTSFCALRGNHEEVFLRFLSDASVLDSWRKFGGLETLHSYGVNVAEAMRGSGYERAQAALIEVLPESHRRFIEKTRLNFSLGDYFFCHAGARPGVDLDQQSSEDLLWIRNVFLQFQGSFGKIVVHGHSPTSAPEVKPNRINVDTGAYASSILTALVLEGETRRFLSTDAGSARNPRP